MVPKPCIIIILDISTNNFFLEIKSFRDYTYMYLVESTCFWSVFTCTLLGFTVKGFHNHPFSTPLFVYKNTVKFWFRPLESQDSHPFSSFTYKSLSKPKFLSKKIFGQPYLWVLFIDGENPPLPIKTSFLTGRKSCHST